MNFLIIFCVIMCDETRRWYFFKEVLGSDCMVFCFMSGMNLFSNFVFLTMGDIYELIVVHYTRSGLIMIGRWLLRLHYKLFIWVDKLLIDGVLVEVKIVEEWGFNIGEYACLFEDDDGQNDHSENEDIHVDLDVFNNVDTLVGKIVDELEETELIGDTKHVIPHSPKNDRVHDDGSPLVLHVVSSMPSAVPTGECVVHSIDVEDDRLRFATPSIPTEVRTEEVTSFLLFSLVNWGLRGPFNYVG